MLKYPIPATYSSDNQHLVVSITQTLIASIIAAIGSWGFIMLAGILLVFLQHKGTPNHHSRRR